MRLVVVGGVAAGTKAASRAKRVEPSLKVAVYQEEPDVSISECGTPYFLSGVTGGREKLVARTPEQFEERGVEVKVRHRVETFDAKNKTLQVKDLQSGRTFRDFYDRLVIATGAKSVRLPIPGSDLEGVFTLRFLTDADRIRAYVKERSPERAVVVGGGYVGLEVAENLSRLGMAVSVVEAGERVAPTYGEEISRRVAKHLRENGVGLYTCSTAEELSCESGEGCEGRVRDVRFGKERLAADIVIVGVGIRPEVSLAERAGAKVGRTGALAVDAHMKTNLPDVWACGDCAETTNLLTGEPVWLPLGDTANKTGRVAGTNAATGEDVVKFPGVLGSGIFKTFDLGVGKTGLSEEEARRAGFEAVCASVEARSKAGYFPGSEKVFFKMTADKETGRVLGAEVVGASADKLTDVAATAIWGGLKCGDLVDVDLAYSPPFGPTLSPVIQAATVLSGKVKSS